MAKTFEPKEHTWYLEVDGEEKIFKCLVNERECITYHGDVEHKHLKVMNPVRKDGVLQIDTITSIYGQQIPFQLENGIPYIHWDGSWQMSETNRQDRITQSIRVNRISAFVQIGVGAASCLLTLIMVMIRGSLGNWWALLVVGLFGAASGSVKLSQLKMEMEAFAQAEAEAAEEKKARLHQNKENG